MIEINKYKLEIPNDRVIRTEEAWYIMLLISPDWVDGLDNPDRNDGELLSLL